MSQQDQIKNYLAKINEASMEVLEINAKFATALMERQATHFKEAVTSGVEAAKRGTKASDVRDFVEVQRDFAQDLGRQVKEFNESNVEAVKENTAQIVKTFREAFSNEAGEALETSAGTGSKGAASAKPKAKPATKAS